MSNDTADTSSVPDVHLRNNLVSGSCRNGAHTCATCGRVYAHASSCTLREPLYGEWAIVSPSACKRAAEHQRENTVKSRP
jgi:hypothetical protein